MGGIPFDQVLFIIFQLGLYLGVVLLLIYFGVRLLHKLQDRSAASNSALVSGPDSPDSIDEAKRASDDDRNRTVAKLQEEVGNGRLTLQDFEERIETAQSATTVGELAQLVRDLPGTSA